MLVLNKQTVSFDQWAEQLMKDARQKGIEKADLFELYQNYQEGMDTDEALIELEKRSQDVVY